MPTAKESKTTLETKVKDAVKEFTSETGLNVSWIEVTKVKGLGFAGVDPSKDLISISAKLGD